MITFVGYYWLLRRMEVGRANLIAYLSPLVALAVGYFLGGEILTPRMLLGSALVLFGVAIANRSRNESRGEPLR
jgi:drug/metabolite transporter (DMT)-like permease